MQMRKVRSYRGQITPLTTAGIKGVIASYTIELLSKIYQRNLGV